MGATGFPQGGVLGPTPAADPTAGDPATGLAHAKRCPGGGAAPLLLVTTLAPPHRSSREADAVGEKPRRAELRHPACPTRASISLLLAFPPLALDVADGRRYKGLCRGFFGAGVVDMATKQAVDSHLRSEKATLPSRIPEFH